MQRLRITFSRGQEIKYISHLDLLRMWERIFRRAAIPLAYSKGFNPHPRLALAAPLPVGVLGSAEMLEVYLESPMVVADFEQSIEWQLPPGVRVSRVEEVELATPSLPAMVRAAEYEVAMDTDMTRREVEERIDRLLWTARLPRERRRPPRDGNKDGNKDGHKDGKKDEHKDGHGGEVRQYDLRPLIEDIWIERWNSEKVLGMRLRADPGGTGRPEEVLDELRLLPDAADATRTKLILAPAPDLSITHKS